MKKILVILALLLFQQGFAQVSPHPYKGTISTAGSDCSTSTNCVSVTIPPETASATITVDATSGSWSGTIQFEGTTDGTHWIAMTPTSNSSSSSSSTTSTGVWQFNPSSYIQIRARASARVSGTAPIVINWSNATASSGGGGSGGTTTHTLTGNSSGGAAPGTTFNGSAGVTFDYHTFGAAALSAANTFGAFLQDLSASTVKVPTAGSFTASASSMIGYDSTNANLHAWNGVDSLVALLAASISPTNNDCVKWTVAAGKYTLNTAGAACGSGGGTTTNSLTINSSGSGGASPQTFNGSSPITISYNTVGAAPASGIALSALATQAADTTVMNATGGSASPTAVAMPTSGTNGCAGASNALIYNTTTHAYGCNTISGSGTVNSGTSGHYAYYASSTNAVSNNSNLDDGVTTANTLTYAGSAGVASGAFTTSGSNGGVTGTEGTCAGLTAGAGKDLLCPNSTLHGWEFNNNNGGYVPAVAGPTSSTSGNLASFSGTSGGIIQDTGTAAANVVTAASNYTSGQFVKAAGNNKTTSSAAIAAGDLPAALSSSTSVNGTSIPSSGTLYNMGTPVAGGIAYGASTSQYSTTSAGTSKQIVISGGTSAPSMIDFPEHLIIPAANCNSSTAGAGWSIPASNAPTVACRAGTNNLGGVLQWANNNTTTNAQFTFQLPTDWDTGTQPYWNIIYGSGSNTSGTVKWTISSACTKSDGSVTDDPSFVAESTSSGKTMAVANRMWAESAQFANLTSGNNCIAGSTVVVKIVSGNGTASSTVNVEQMTITVPRLLTVQAD